MLIASSLAVSGHAYTLKHALAGYQALALIMLKLGSGFGIAPGAVKTVRLQRILNQGLQTGSSETLSNAGLSQRMASQSLLASGKVTCRDKLEMVAGV
ncbi:MAG: hypothetical protein ACLT9W_04515 [Streptococcus sp.]